MRWEFEGSCFFFSVPLRLSTSWLLRTDFRTRRLGHDGVYKFASGMLLLFSRAFERGERCA